MLALPCHDFLAAVPPLEVAVSNSLLGRAGASWPDLRMYYSREALCTWAQQTISLDPVRSAPPLEGVAPYLPPPAHEAAPGVAYSEAALRAGYMKEDPYGRPVQPDRRLNFIY